MEQRQLGNQGLVVSELGLGCMGMSEFYGTTDESEAIATIHRALELGVTLLDTADMYGVGHNEELVGKAIKDRRDRVIIATKFGNVRGSDGSFLGVNGHLLFPKPPYAASAPTVVPGEDPSAPPRLRVKRVDGPPRKQTLRARATRPAAP